MLLLQCVLTKSKRLMLPLQKNWRTRLISNKVGNIYFSVIDKKTFHETRICPIHGQYKSFMRKF